MAVEIAFLRDQAIFGGLEDEELAKIAELLKEERYAPGEIIVEEGDLAQEMYLIETGSVEILKSVSGEVERQKISELKEGDCFGEMSLIDIKPRSATVRAVEPTVVLTLSTRDLYQLQRWRLSTYTLIIMNIAREISRRLRRSDAITADFFLLKGEGERDRRQEHAAKTAGMESSR
ncbi:MAG: cyclic nucleotide-binding domain-containing protein [Deltaproteobacteria bacterium]|nr:MAG: cyclic nucleotide-binding domain-containing protein [Deltaproteobacteria bacterium]